MPFWRCTAPSTSWSMKKTSSRQARLSLIYQLLTVDTMSGKLGAPEVVIPGHSWSRRGNRNGSRSRLRASPESQRISLVGRSMLKSCSPSLLHLCSLHCCRHAKESLEQSNSYVGSLWEALKDSIISAAVDKHKNKTCYEFWWAILSRFKSAVLQHLKVFKS